MSQSLVKAFLGLMNDLTAILVLISNGQTTCLSSSVGSECECIGHFKLIFSLLRVHGAGQVQQLALEVSKKIAWTTFLFPNHST